MRYRKLVRDRIPERIRERGKEPVVRTLSKKEYRDALERKLQEEVREYVRADSREEHIEELADIQEVLMAIYELEDIACSDVSGAGRKKRKTHGAFTKRYWLEGVR